MKTLMKRAVMFAYGQRLISFRTVEKLFCQFDLKDY